MKEYLIVFNGGQCSKPILANNSEEACEKLKDQFESFEGIPCDIIADCDKRIVDAIRERLPQFRDKSNVFIILHTDLVSRVEELIGNEGMTIKEAVDTL